MVRNPEKLAGPLRGDEAQARVSRLGPRRHAGDDGRPDHDGKPKRIDWHLVAGSGHGPYIPATASVLLAKRLLDGTLQTRGAMPCVGLFTLDEFLPRSAISTSRRVPHDQPLYRRLLGERFEQLPARVRELHDVAGTSVWTGRADVERGRSLPSRMVATLFGLPPAGRDQALRVTFEWTATGKSGRARSATRCSARCSTNAAACCNERVGPSTFVFALETSAEGMALKLHGVRFLGVPLPRSCAVGAHVRKRARRPLPFRGGSEPAAAGPDRAL